MTPAEALNYTPTDAVIVHETGHLVSAMNLGMTVSNLEFPHAGTGDQGRALIDSEGHHPERVIQMLLAGPISQLIEFGDMVDAEFRHRVLVGGLFTTADALDDGGSVEMEMLGYGFGGDWKNIKLKLASISTNKESARETAERAHRAAIGECSSPAFRALVRATVADIKSWLKEDHPRAAEWRSRHAPVVYDAARAASVRGRLGRAST